MAKVHDHGVYTRALDRIAELRAAAIDLDTQLLRKPLADVDVGDRAIQAVELANTGDEAQRLAVDALRERLGIGTCLEVALALRLGALLGLLDQAFAGQ